VDLVDLNNVRNNFGAVGASVLGDTNDDGRVDLQDLNAVRNSFGATATSAAAVHWSGSNGIDSSVEPLVEATDSHRSNRFKQAAVDRVYELESIGWIRWHEMIDASSESQDRPFAPHRKSRRFFTI
jgi:hypothetical protein